MPPSPPSPLRGGCAQVCLSTIRVLSDLCNALQAGLAPSCDEVVAIMLTNLGSPAVHRSLKPELLSAFGDLAYAIGTGFTKYIEPVRSMLNQAMHMSMQMAVQTHQSQGAARIRSGQIRPLM